MGFLREFGKWVRFAYFLRFAWGLWFFAPLLCLINIASKTLTSGILVAEYWEQYLCISFFLVSAGLAALVLARVALINGPDRWDLTAAGQEPRPHLLKALLVNDDGRHEFLAVSLAQAPNLFVFFYLTYFGVCQGVGFWTIVPGILLGASLAFIFWWNANAWYYLTFKAQHAAVAPDPFTFGRNAARTILFPRAFFKLNVIRSDCPGKPTIEQADTLLTGAGFHSFDQAIGLRALRQFLIDRSGYGFPGTNSFYEAHNFTAISIVMFGGLYLLIWPLTAPVIAPVASWIAIGALGVFIAFVLTVFWTATPAQVNGQTRKLTRIRIWITLTIVAFFGTVVWLFCFTAVERFPIFATVLILAIALGWILGAVAFFFDRYRVPVITLLLVAMVIPRMFHLDRTLYADGSGIHKGQEEHYVSITEAQGQLELPDPQKVLEDRLAAVHDDKPFIIVTATGGGLHASAWTATVLARLEQKFGPDFHNHLLLASTVSGGSVGLMAYLSELHRGGLDKSPDVDQSNNRVIALNRMQSVAQCSSLEGVGWGLVYYDLPKALIPVFPYFIPPSSGDGDLDTNGFWKTPLGKDRTWALRKSFLRNLDDSYCWGIWGLENPTAKAGPEPGRKRTDESRSGITLRDFQAGAGPALTMNTTVVETGERFLSANYRIPDCRMEEAPNPDYHARSFLETFKNRVGQANYTDLPLASAAQLSATFPYVSSAARAPMIVDNAVGGVHFADGGYYDNDGTASALEFLRYALGPPAVRSPSSTEPEPPQFSAPCRPVTVNKPLRVLLIEIRNSDAIYGSSSESSPYHNGGTSPWNLFSQGGAPLLGFWQAGHESITPRDQSALELLEHTYPQALYVRSVVIADRCSTAAVGTDPLNWALTPRQRKEVQHTAQLLEMQRLYDVAFHWYQADQDAWAKPPVKGDGMQLDTPHCSPQ